MTFGLTYKFGGPATGRVRLSTAHMRCLIEVGQRTERASDLSNVCTHAFVSQCAPTAAARISVPFSAARSAPAFQLAYRPPIGQTELKPPVDKLYFVPLPFVVSRAFSIYGPQRSDRPESMNECEVPLNKVINSLLFNTPLIEIQ